MDLQARVERLERDNGRLKRVLLGGLLLAGLAVTMGQAKQPEAVQQAKKFVVVDDKGRQRIVLGMDDDEPSLSFTDTDGQTVVQLHVPKIHDKPALHLRDPAEAAGMELAMTANGPVLHFTDKSGTRVRLATNELNAPFLAIFDSDGKKLFGVSSEK